jgi:hypothetical protein
VVSGIRTLKYEQVLIELLLPDRRYLIPDGYARLRDVIGASPKERRHPSAFFFDVQGVRISPSLGDVHIMVSKPAQILMQQWLMIHMYRRMTRLSTATSLASLCSS